MSINQLTQHPGVKDGTEKRPFPALPPSLMYPRIHFQSCVSFRTGNSLDAEAATPPGAAQKPTNANFPANFPEQKAAPSV